MNKKNMEEIKQMLKDKGIPPSYHRISIYKYLKDNINHPTVDTIYKDLSKKIPTLSKTTIYSTLKLLTRKNIVQEILIDDNEVRYDYNTKPHAHFKCTKCGKIYDIFIKSELFNIKNIEDFSVNHTDIFFRGVCEKCKNK